MATRPRNTSGQKRPTPPKQPTQSNPVEIEKTEMTTPIEKTEIENADVDDVATPTTETTSTETGTKHAERLQAPVQEVPEFDLSKKKVEEVKLAHNLTMQTTSPELATKVDKNPTVEGFLLRKYSLTEEDYSKRLKSVVRDMSTYIAAMNMAAPVDKETGKKHQFRLLQTIRTALDTKDYAEAAVCYDALLFMVARNLDTTFNERLICRFIYQLSERDQIIFSNLVNIIINTANPRTRAVGLKTVDLKLAIKRVGGGYIATNMLNFYSENMK